MGRKHIALALVIACVSVCVIVGWFFVRTFSTKPVVVPGLLDIPSTASSTEAFSSARGGFSFLHPRDLIISRGNIAPTRSWSHGSVDPGVLDATTTIPALFEPQTNFVEARFSVGRSANDHAVAHCLSATTSPQTSVTHVDINGTAFTRISFSEAGTGTFSETTSFRTVHAGVCYALEYTIRSANLDTFGPDQRATGFDKTKIVNIFEYMVRSFEFQ